MVELSGFNALVTGGGRGIGAAIAAALTRAGARVTVLGRSESALTARVRAGDAASYILADVTGGASFADVVGALASRERIDILVNNAGGALSAPFLKTTDADFEALWKLNFLAPVTATRVFLPGMIERKFGRVINIASTAGLKGYPYVSAYVAAKHALIGFTRALALETAKSGVTVNAVCPGFTDTDMTKDSVNRITAKTGRTTDAVQAEFLKFNPMGRLIEPVEVARAACFLAAPGSGAITGQAIAVAGGEV